MPSPDTVLNETLYLFFQPSGSWNPLILIFSASSLAFSFRIDADTTTFLLLTVKSHLKLRSSKFANVPCLNHQRFDLFPCAFIDSKIFSLFLIQVDNVFFGMPYFIATWDFDDPSSTSFKAEYLSWLILVFSFLFVATVAIVKCKHNDPELNLQHSMHARTSYNSIRISKANIRTLCITMQSLHHVLN